MISYRYWDKELSLGQKKGLTIFYDCKPLFLLLNGAPGRIRTSDRSVRSRVLYPAELQAHKLSLFLRERII